METWGIYYYFWYFYRGQCNKSQSADALISFAAFAEDMAWYVYTWEWRLMCPSFEMHWWRRNLRPNPYVCFFFFSDLGRLRRFLNFGLVTGPPVSSVSPAYAPSRATFRREKRLNGLRCRFRLWVDEAYSEWGHAASEFWIPFVGLSDQFWDQVFCM